MNNYEIEQFKLEMNNHQQELNNLYNQMMEQEANYQNQLLYKRIENFIWDNFIILLAIFIAIILIKITNEKTSNKSNKEDKEVKK